MNNETLNNDRGIGMGEKKGYDKARQVDQIADRLMEKLKANASSRPFLCKAAWKLPENVIYNNLEAATSPKCKNPMGLFIYLCKRDGV